MLSSLPEWIPFACLLTASGDKALRIMRKAMLTRIIENVIITALGAFAALVIGYNVMANDLKHGKEEFAQHVQFANKRFEEIKEVRKEDRDETNKKLDIIANTVGSLDRCLRERTCTK